MSIVNGPVTPIALTCSMAVPLLVTVSVCVAVPFSGCTPKSSIPAPVSIDGQDGWRVPANAESAGLNRGDFIVGVNGAGPDQLMDAMRAATTGQVELSVLRGGERVTLMLAADAPA